VDQKVGALLHGAYTLPDQLLLSLDARALLALERRAAAA
jgi:hypothetical protein